MKSNRDTKLQGLFNAQVMHHLNQPETTPLISFPWCPTQYLPPPTLLSIADLVTVFIREDSPLPVGVDHFGIRGEREPITLPQSIEQDLRQYHIP